MGGGDLEYLLRLLHWAGTLRHPRAGLWSSRAFYARKALVMAAVVLFLSSHAAVIVLEGTADLDRFTRALCFFNTSFIWLLRLTHVAVRERRFHAMVLQMGSDFGEFVTRRDAALLSMRGRSLRRFVLAYLSFGAVAGIGWDVFPLVRYGVCSEGLPFYMALPYSVDQPLAFAATWLFCFCITMHVAVITMVFDSYNVSLMAQLRQQLSVLSGNIRALADEGGRELLSVAYSSQTMKSPTPVKSNHLRHRLRSIIRHHQAIIRNVESLEECLGSMLLGQSLSIGASICFQLFQVATSAESLAEAGKFGCYLSVMLAQLFVYCWFGDDLITEVLNVSYSFFAILRNFKEE
ncbi:odorant receptor 4-like [Schistocerca piceifrons]|uniref:odorant receptor 4-like n=1 Tax=Schistocerca piceifrons TaxID=274613 RepID=UPI001F5F908D|nr:odorant receptor 4-like [Schistocerca piceifrons]